MSGFSSYPCLCPGFPLTRVYSRVLFFYPCLFPGFVLLPVFVSGVVSLPVFVSGVVSLPVFMLGFGLIPVFMLGFGLLPVFVSGLVSLVRVCVRVGVFGPGLCRFCHFRVTVAMVPLLFDVFC